MPYEPVAHGKLHGLDYRAPRPFMDWRRPDLLEKIQEWVALNPPRLELATLAYDELKNRGENQARLLYGSFRSTCRHPLVDRSAARSARRTQAIHNASRQWTALCDPSFRLLRRERLLRRLCRCNQTPGRRAFPSASEPVSGRPEVFKNTA